VRLFHFFSTFLFLTSLQPSLAQMPSAIYSPSHSLLLKKVFSIPTPLLHLPKTHLNQLLPNFSPLLLLVLPFSKTLHALVSFKQATMPMPSNSTGNLWLRLSDPALSLLWPLPTLYLIEHLSSTLCMLHFQL